MSHDEELVRRSDVFTEPMNKLEDALKEMPENMRAFSMSLRQLYVQYAVGTNEDAAVKFRKIRDQTYRETQDYIDKVLPYCEKLIWKTDGIFYNYVELDDYMWGKCLPLTKKNIEEGTAAANNIKVMHEKFITVLIDREQEANVVMRELEEVQETLKTEKCSLDKKSKEKAMKAHKYTALRDYRKAAEKLVSLDMVTAKAVAYDVNAVTHELAICKVRNTLIPSLKRFISNIDTIIEFILVLQNNNIAIFQVDRVQARNVKYHCQRFIRCLPSVVTDFKAIPTEGTEQSCADVWLEKQQQAAKETEIPIVEGTIFAVIHSPENGPQSTENVPEEEQHKENVQMVTAL